MTARSPRGPQCRLGNGDLGRPQGEAECPQIEFVVVRVEAIVVAIPVCYGARRMMVS